MLNDNSPTLFQLLHGGGGGYGDSPNLSEDKCLITILSQHNEPAVDYSHCKKRKLRKSDPNSFLTRPVSEQELNQVIMNPQFKSLTHTVEVWRRYIYQQGVVEGIDGQFKAMERMILAYKDDEAMRSNRYYGDVWIRYVRASFIIK